VPSLGPSFEGYTAAETFNLCFAPSGPVAGLCPIGRYDGQGHDWHTLFQELETRLGRACEDAQIGRVLSHCWKFWEVRGPIPHQPVLSRALDAGTEDERLAKLHQ